MNLNKYFSKDKVKDISDRIFRHGKYGGSDFESSASIHYAEGHGVEYHENDKTKIKKQRKKKIRKDKDKTIVDERLKKNDLNNNKKGN